MNSVEKNVTHAKLAMQLAIQLPENPAEAQRVLQCLQKIVEYHWGVTRAPTSRLTLASVRPSSVVTERINCAGDIDG
jgi:hypothetical protein